ncbi:MAG: hypothetical protein LAT62_05620 [Natronospirillum sp.]|uniref:hypothetical protein n=1 Tax=Natronospirillum sp. TaxID=2812955 RepID=UPI0025D8A13B|nr:hypothetical protein [Natronospirillum sp.]MCH8551394.1 hypothetical protein [Natronospirillum sp.]
MFKRYIPASIYSALTVLGLAMLADGALGPDWVFCTWTSALCVGDLGRVGITLLALYGSLGMAIAGAFGFMLYRVLRLGGARVTVNHDDRLLVSRAIGEIRDLCQQGEYGKALFLVETLRRKYPDNRQLRELEKRLNKALDQRSQT